MSELEMEANELKPEAADDGALTVHISIGEDGEAATTRTLEPTTVEGLNGALFTKSASPCFICGTRWASRWTDGRRFTDDELVDCFGVTGKGLLCQGCRAAVYHRRRTGGKRTFFHFTNSRRNDSGPGRKMSKPSTKRDRRPSVVKHSSPSTSNRSKSSSALLHRHKTSPKAHSSSSRQTPAGQSQCEFCQHVGPLSDFMPSARFCSLRCSRAYSTQFRLANRAKAVERSASSVDSSTAFSPTTEYAPSAFSEPRLPLQANGHDYHDDDENGPPFYDEDTDQYFLDENHRAPLLLAGYGLMPREREGDGSLVFKRLPRVDLPAHLHQKPAKSWSVEDCKSCLVFHKLSREAGIFEEHDIDGPAFLLLKLEQMIRIIGLKVGPALKLESLSKNLKLMEADTH